MGYSRCMFIYLFIIIIMIIIFILQSRFETVKSHIVILINKGLVGFLAFLELSLFVVKMIIGPKPI